MMPLSKMSKRFSNLYTERIILYNIWMMNAYM